MANLIKTFLAKIGELVIQHHKKIILAVLGLLLIAFIGISSVQMNMGMDLYLNQDSQVNENWQRLQEEFAKGNEVFIMLEVETGDIYEVERMEEIEGLYQNLYEREKFTFVTSPAHPVKSGPGEGELLETKEEILHSLNATRANHRTADIMIDSLIPDDQTGIIIAQYGNVDIPEDRDRFFGLLPATEEEIIEQEVEDAIDDSNLSDEIEATVTGAPIFEEAAFGLMLPEMVRLFAIAVIIIVMTVFLLMKSKIRRFRDVLFPLLTAVSTLLLMLGFMGFAGYDIEPITLGVLPIALGLSIDYGLQIQSRYLEEKAKGFGVYQAVKTAISNTGRALSFAMITTLIGLGTLLISDVPPTRDFGAIAGFAVFVGMILSITLLPSLVIVFDKIEDGGENKVETNKYNDSLLERTVAKLSKIFCLKKGLVISVFAILIFLGIIAYPQVETTQEMFDYWPEIEQKRDLEYLEDIVDSPQIMHAIVEFDTPAYNKNSFEQVAEFQKDLEEIEYVNTVLSPARAIEMGNDGVLPESEAEFDEALTAEKQVDRPPVLGRDVEQYYPNSILVQMFIEDIEGKPVRELINNAYDSANEYLPNQEVSITGKPVVNRNVIENVTAGLTEMTVLSFSLVFVFLALVLLSFKYSAVLLGSVSVSAVLLTAGAMYIFNIPWNPLTVTVASIILGIGIDYGVHVYERYLEERKEKQTLEAVKEALTKKARPILASGLTTMLGFGVLVLSDFPVLANFGKAILAAMISALLGTFVLLPAVLILVELKNSD